MGFALSELCVVRNVRTGKKYNLKYMRHVGFARINIGLVNAFSQRDIKKMRSFELVQ